MISFKGQGTKHIINDFVNCKIEYFKEIPESDYQHIKNDIHRYFCPDIDKL